MTSTTQSGPQIGSEGRVFPDPALDAREQLGVALHQLFGAFDASLDVAAPAGVPKNRVQDRIAVDRSKGGPFFVYRPGRSSHEETGGGKTPRRRHSPLGGFRAIKSHSIGRHQVAEPPPILGKSKKIGVLMWAPAPDVLYRLSVEAALRRTPDPHDNRTLFIEAMPDPVRRRVAFDVVERNCRQWLGEGEEGVRLYGQLLNYVRQANVVRAVSEFQQRFLPMLDQQYLRQRGREARRTTRE